MALLAVGSITNRNTGLIEPLSIKHQKRTNTCVWQSYAVSREATEGAPLSPKSLVRYAITRGYIRGNGFSTLREGQKAGIEFGVAEESLLDNSISSWRDYAWGGLSDRVKENAYKHKGKSYFSVRSKNETLKALDDGIPIHTGFTWRSSYNMSGGLRAPYVLPIGRGYVIGGHAFTLIGYDLDKGLYKFQNSCGEGYGEKGCFYVRMDVWHRISPQGYVTVDMDDMTIAEFLKSYEGKEVKIKENPAIYKIENGKLRAFTDPLTFHAHGGSFEPESYTLVASKLLDMLEDGEPMMAHESPHWPKLFAVWQELNWGDPKVSIEVIKDMIN